MAFLDDVAKRLVDTGVGVLNQSIFLSSKANIPDGNGPYMTLTEAGGMAPIRRQEDVRPAYRRPSVQLRVRAASYPVARNMLQAAYDSLVEVQNLAINGNTYFYFTPRQDITDMGLDEQSRAQVVINFDAFWAT